MKKYSKKWMQTFVEGKFPEDNSQIIEKISKHAFEVEDVEVVDDDSLFEIKVLPNRVSDAFCLRGMAREFATVFNLPLLDLYKTPMMNDISKYESKNDFVEIKNPATKCYFGVSVEIDKQIDTPTWIKDIIEKSGGRSINSLVDITNLMLYSFGQPTHVFDTSKISGKIITRLADKGEKITLLDGKVLELTGIENLITDEQNALALAGIKGGKVAEVDGNTTKAFFEIANFDADNVRLTSLKQNIRTDASKIYENSLSINTTEEVLTILVNTVLEIYPSAKINFISKQYSDAKYENYLTENKNAKITFTVSDVTRSAGINISKEEVVKILKRLNFDILNENGEELTIQAHKDRLDINIKEDLLEEILRIYGFDNIPSVPLKVENNFFTHNKRFLLENFLKSFFLNKGFTELYNYTFVEKGDLKVLLPLADDKSYLRNNLLDGGIKAYQKNYNYLPSMQSEVVKFFEIGSAFLADKEERRMLLCLEDGKPPSRKATAGQGKKTCAEQLMEVVNELETKLNVKIELINKNEKPALVEFSIDKILESDVNLKFEIFNKDLQAIKYKPISVYPFIVRDIATWVPEQKLGESFVFENLKQEILQLNLQNVEKIYAFDSFTKKLESGEEKTSIAFRIIFQSYEKTLTDEEVEKEMVKVQNFLDERNYEIR
jgi:phenylalanyl-tRNA synthetase beta chain